VTDSSILVLGAGELGTAVFRNLVKRAAPSSGPTVTALIRPSTIDSRDLGKQRDLDELRSLGVNILLGDLAAGSTADPSALFRDFLTVIGCTGFVGGPGFQPKLARAVLGAGVRRYLPWQLGVNYDVIGRVSGQDLFDE
jgi:hypothetical protein